MADDVVDLIPLFKAELELCAVRPGEQVGIFSENGTRGHYAEAFGRAAAELGATPIHIDLPGTGAKDFTTLGGRSAGRGLAGAPAALDALKQCDLMIDLMLILFEPELGAIKEAGTRVVSCVEEPGVLERLLPTPDQRRRAEASRDLMTAASTLHLTSASGTDVEYVFGDFTPFCQYGYADTPGRWDHFPSTHVVHCANENGVNGTVVIAPGDVILPFSRYVTDPIRITIVDGYMERIEGGADALLFGDYIESFGDRRASAISHIGWGLNERARWDCLMSDPGTLGMDARGYEGCVMFATGPNTEFGGDNDTPCHFDIPLRGCTLRLDDTLLIESGRILDERIASGGSEAVDGQSLVIAT